MKKILLSVFALSACVALSAQVIMSEDFESGAMPTGWSQQVAASAPAVTWGFGTNTQEQSQYFNLTNPHTKFACVNDDAGNSSSAHNLDTLYSPSFSLSSATNPYLSFDYYYFDINNANAQETATIQISTNGGSTWTTLQTISVSTAQDVWYDNTVINLSSYAGQSNVKIAFTYDDHTTWAYGFALDNVKIFQPSSFDAGISEITTNPYQLMGTIQIKGSFMNYGSTGITSCDINYSINGGATQTYNWSGSSVAFNATKPFISNIPFNPASTGNYNLKMWTSNINGNADQNNTNDTMSMVIHVLSFMPTKRICFEEATGTWCGWCPRGHVFMDSMRIVHPTNTALISVHNNDPMTVAAYDAAIGGYISGFPSAVADRTETIDPSEMFTYYNAHYNDATPVAVYVTANYDSTTKQITVNVSGKFAAQFSNANFRLNGVICENDVTGTGSSWDQHNYYSSSSQNQPLVGAGHNWQTSPNPIPAADMEYDMVARAILGGFSGTAGSIPATINPNDSMGHQYTYTVSAGQDAATMYAVGMVIDQATGDIVNAQWTPVTGGGSPAGITNLSDNASVRLYPNPTSNHSIVRVNISNTSIVSVNVYNMVGQKVINGEDNTLAAGHYNYNLDFTNLNSGIYFVKISVNNKVITKKLSVIK